MKQRKLLIFIFLLAFLPMSAVRAQIIKMAKVGKMEARIYDHGCQSHEVYDHSMCVYFRGSYVSVADAYQNTWPGGILKSGGMLFGARNWTDTTGYTHDAMITGHNTRLRELNIYQFALPAEDGLTIHRYYRCPPPVIIIDGVHTEDPFIFGDVVDPDRIAQWGGTADVMIESDYRLSMGVDVKQRVLGWSQPGHDDYVIWDLTFVNTGNVDEDPEIELPGQTLNDVYIAKVNEAMINGTGDNKALATFAGTTEDHDTKLSYPQDDDSLRIDYMTPLRAGSSTQRDSYGFNVSLNQWNILTGARFGGNAVLFAPKSCDVPQSHPIGDINDIAASNDPAQPSMHTSLLAEPSWITLHDGILSDFPAMDSAEFVDAYKIMVMGVFGIDSAEANFQETFPMDSLYDVYDTTASGAPTYYELPVERWGEVDPARGYAYASDISWLRFDQQTHWSIGPYQMEFGDTLRYVYAYVGGAVSRKTSYLAGEAWNNSVADTLSWLAGLDSAQMVEELRRRDPIFDVFYTTPVLVPAPTVNDIAKDLLVASGRDSLFNNGMNAQRNFNMNYEIPASPNPPSVFEVTSMNDMIRLTWSYNTGYEPDASDLEKFRIYRALGGYVYEKQGAIITGDWQLIDSVDGALRIYEDTAVTPAVDYYYAITAVSDEGVESGMFLTMTVLPARLQSAPGDSLEDIRIVPNPLNVDALGRYSEGWGLKLTFVELPAECTITILTESGELVTEIEHVGGGTEPWEISNQYLVTDSDQYPASGIYIAYIRTPDGQSISRKFAIIR